MQRCVPETIQEVIELTGFLCFLFRSTPNREVLWRQNRDFKFFRFGSRTFACCADMGPPTGNRGAPGATSGPLFPSNMTLQESNWVGPNFICGFCVAAKLAFSDRPLAPRGPKKGQKGPFGATHAKNGIDRLEANRISVV